MLAVELIKGNGGSQVFLNTCPSVLKFLYITKQFKTPSFKLKMLSVFLTRKQVLFQTDALKC